MADIIICNAFRVFTFTLNYVSPSIIADILLHPFDFATVLLQIGFNPEGVKGATTLVSAVAQYALFTFYIPYLFTTTQGVQFMGLPHPSMFYYVNYIFRKDGFLGLYRGIFSKICERIIMMTVTETIKDTITESPSEQEEIDSVYNNQCEEEHFRTYLINSLCAHFFAVVASHPFHVIMISSFAEFTIGKHNSMYVLARMIYDDDGIYGYFIGLGPRVIGELLSLTFSMVYTRLLRKQLRTPEEQVTDENQQQDVPQRTTRAHFAYVRSKNVFRSSTKDNSFDVKGKLMKTAKPARTAAHHVSPFGNLLASIKFGQPLRAAHTSVNSIETLFSDDISAPRRMWPSLLEAVPLTSKFFYYLMLRDFLAKKISYPFYMVCQCMIVLDTGWEKLSIMPYIMPLMKLLLWLLPKKRCD